LGAALFAWYQLLGHQRQIKGTDFQHASLLGPAYSDPEIQTFLESTGAVFETCVDDDQLAGRIADLIASERVVGWFQGQTEFGPRALGSRSIIGDARSEKMQSVMNLKIKFRKSFRPFAPCVLRELVDKYFDMRPQEDSPYVLVAPIRDDKRDRQLRQFAWIAFVFGALLAVLHALNWLPGWLVLSLGTFLFFVFLSSFLCLCVTRYAYVGMVAVTYPVGLTLGFLFMIIFYGLIRTPVGLFFRLIGRDYLQLKFTRSAATYWVPRKQPKL
jgi:hypothetical protein